ncbi:MAG: hypothetical protein LUE27_08440 [Clostridia bacterium]|nr:hypothetical protein [Clostridia bacterium]
MARYQCKCGHIMHDTDDPSEYVLEVYTGSEIEDALKYNPDLLWFHLLQGWDEKQQCMKQYMHHPEAFYWYCTKCKRVTEVDVQALHGTRVYKRIAKIPKGCDESWDTLYAVREVDIFPYTDANDDLTEDEYINRIPHKYSYKISPDKSRVIAYDNEGKPAFEYALEREYHWDGDAYTIEDHKV